MAKVLTLSIARTADGNGLPLPSYSSRYHVGLNLQAAVPAALRLEPGDRAYVPTGFAFGIPDGYCGLVVSQPQMAKEQGLIVLDGPQIVNPADRGALFMLLQNMSSHVVVLHRGDVVAQLVIEPIVQVNWNDLSGKTEGRDHMTQTREVVIDSMASVAESEEKDKMGSSKRIHKSPRNRFSEEAQHEEV